MYTRSFLRTMTAPRLIKIYSFRGPCTFCPDRMRSSWIKLCIQATDTHHNIFTIFRARLLSSDDFRSEDPVLINSKSQSVTNGNATAALKRTAPMFAGELATGASYAVSHAGRQNYADCSLLARTMYSTVRMTLVGM